LAGLAQLRMSMTAAILLLSLIFAAFLVAIMALLQLPLVFAVIGTAIFVLIQYLIGPAVVRWSTGLRYLRPGENPWLETTVRDLAQKSGLPTPRLAVVPDRTPNAFVFGRSASGATLAVHEGLLTQLDQEEVQGVIGHELGHVRHRDFLVMTVLSALPLIAYIVARGTLQASRHAKKKPGVALLAAAAISYAVYFVSLLCVRGLSRLREHYADAYSAYVTGSPRWLESGLTKIAYGLSLAPEPPHGARALYIGDPALARQECQGIVERKAEYDLDRDGVLDERELELAMEREAESTWTRIHTSLATHPPTYRRILLLREIDEEMISGRYTSDRIYTRI